MQHQMRMVGHHREAEQVNPQQPGEELNAFLNPNAAVLKILAACPIAAALRFD